MDIIAHTQDVILCFDHMINRIIILKLLWLVYRQRQLLIRFELVLLCHWSCALLLYFQVVYSLRSILVQTDYLLLLLSFRLIEYLIIIISLLCLTIEQYLGCLTREVILKLGRCVIILHNENVVVSDLRSWLHMRN